MVPITTKTHVKQGGGLLKTLQIPYNQNHLSQLRRVSTRFPTVSSLPKTQRAPGGDSWEQLPPFVPNNLGLSSPLNICKRHPNKFHYLPAVLECHVCFRDVGWGGCCFDIQVWGWLKRIVFFLNCLAKKKLDDTMISLFCQKDLDVSKNRETPQNGWWK